MSQSMSAQVLCKGRSPYNNQFVVPINGAIDMTKRYQEYRRAKHIDICHHFVKEKIEMGDFIPVYISSEDNVANLNISKGHNAKLCDGFSTLPAQGGKRAN